MNSRQEFEEDLTVLLSRLTNDSDERIKNKLNILKDSLINLRKANIVKINHSIMELVCARYLIEKGYEVLIEQPLNETLSCDLFAAKGLGTLIVEVDVNSTSLILATLKC